MTLVDVKLKWPVVLLLVCVLVACAPAHASPPPVGAMPSPVVLRTVRPSLSPFPTPTRGATLTPAFTATPGSAILTPSPYAQYTIDALRTRQYFGGAAQDLGIYSQNDTFARHSFVYPSDALNIHGFVNVPLRAGKYPVIIAIHGYVDPTQYDTLDYTTDPSDGLSSSGYFVVHPNLRNFRPSDQGDALFRVGYAIDVLNLIAVIKQNAGKPGLFEFADASHIGIWSHSMGGDIALRVAVVSSDVQAILLYAPMSGDEQKNSQFFNVFTGNSVNQQELLASAQDFSAISPATYYADISAAIQLHHGTGDTVIPVAWAEETCQQLKDAGRNVECYYYDGADHTFRSRYYEQFGPRLEDFFAKYLKN